MTRRRTRWQLLAGANTRCRQSRARYAVL
jgi:hypothetical protein